MTIEEMKNLIDQGYVVITGNSRHKYYYYCLGQGEYFMEYTRPQGALVTPPWDISLSDLLRYLAEEEYEGHYTKEEYELLTSFGNVQ